MEDHIKRILLDYSHRDEQEPWTVNSIRRTFVIKQARREPDLRRSCSPGKAAIRPRGRGSFYNFNEAVIGSVPQVPARKTERKNISFFRSRINWTRARLEGRTRPSLLVGCVRVA
jgi:hypothetical protein